MLTASQAEARRGRQDVLAAFFAKQRDVRCVRPRSGHLGAVIAATHNAILAADIAEGGGGAQPEVAAHRTLPELLGHGVVGIGGKVPPHLLAGLLSAGSDCIHFFCCWVSLLWADNEGSGNVARCGGDSTLKEIVSSSGQYHVGSSGWLGRVGPVPSMQIGSEKHCLVRPCC